jgi:hypothetical protein
VEQGSQKAKSQDDEDGYQWPVAHAVCFFLARRASDEEINHTQYQESADGHLRHDRECN